jgi:hypothetical protein
MSDFLVPCLIHNVNLFTHDKVSLSGLSTNQSDTALALASGLPRTPARFRTEIGLLFLIASLIGFTIIQPLHAFSGPYLASPIFSYEINWAITILLTTLFSIGGLLIVSGRKPFGPVHSQQSLFGFLIVAAAALFGSVVAPYIPLPDSAGGITWYVSTTILSIAETAVAVIGIVLLTYSIQSPKGKILLWLGAIVGLAVAIALDSQNLRLFPHYPAIIQRSIFSLGALGTGLFAASFLALWVRVSGNSYPLLDTHRIN